MPLKHVLRHQEGIVLEQGALHVLALSRGMALVQRGEDRHRTEHPPHHVIHRRAGTQRAKTPSRHVGQAAHHLHHFIQAGAVFVRPGQKSLQRAINDFRLQLFEIGVAETQFLHRTESEILGHHVGAGYQFQHQFPPLFRLQIDGDAFFVTVVAGEKARTRGRQLARMVAVERLDLDHFGTEIGEHQPAGRSHDHVAELDDTDAFEREFFIHDQFHCFVTKIW